MRATGQPPNDCKCGTASSSSSHNTPGCSTDGCSDGDNLACYDGVYASPPAPDITPYGADRRPPPGSIITYGYVSFYGCHCPGYYYNTTNAYYYTVTGSPYITVYANGYNYTTCTEFGLNARDLYGNIPGDVNGATNCCNFCCNRTDPYTTPPPPPTSGGRGIILKKSIYLSGLTMLILIALKLTQIN